MTNEVEYWTERLIKEVVLLNLDVCLLQIWALKKASAVWPFMSRTISRLRLRTLLMKCLPSAMNETHGAVKRKLNITAKK